MLFPTCEQQSQTQQAENLEKKSPGDPFIDYLVRGNIFRIAITTHAGITLRCVRPSLTENRMNATSVGRILPLPKDKHNH